MFDDVAYSLHLVVDGRDEAAAESMMAAARAIALERGREIESSLPKVMRGTPFVPPNSMLGPDGGVIDDLIAYYLGPDRYRLIVNAATRQCLRTACSA